MCLSSHNENLVICYSIVIKKYLQNTTFFKIKTLQCMQLNKKIDKTIKIITESNKNFRNINKVIALTEKK